MEEHRARDATGGGTYRSMPERQGHRQREQLIHTETQRWTVDRTRVSASDRQQWVGGLLEGQATGEQGWAGPPPILLIRPGVWLLAPCSGSGPEFMEMTSKSTKQPETKVCTRHEVEFWPPTSCGTLSDWSLSL